MKLYPITKLQRMSRKDRRSHEHLPVTRSEHYAWYGNPTLAEFIGSNAICDVCYAVTPDMDRHMDWHGKTKNASTLNERLRDL